jgi:hypothetical protein
MTHADTALGGYVVDLDRRRLEGAPTYTPAKEPDCRTYPERIDAYYANRRSDRWRTKSPA